MIIEYTLATSPKKKELYNTDITFEVFCKRIKGLTKEQWAEHELKLIKQRKKEGVCLEYKVIEEGR